MVFKDGYQHNVGLLGGKVNATKFLQEEGVPYLQKTDIQYTPQNWDNLVDNLKVFITDIDKDRGFNAHLADVLSKEIQVLRSNIDYTKRLQISEDFWELKTRKDRRNNERAKKKPKRDRTNRNAYTDNLESIVNCVERGENIVDTQMLANFDRENYRAAPDTDTDTDSSEDELDPQDSAYLKSVTQDVYQKLYDVRKQVTRIFGQTQAWGDGGMMGKIQSRPKPSQQSAKPEGPLARVSQPSVRPELGSSSSDSEELLQLNKGLASRPSFEKLQSFLTAEKIP